MTKIEFVREIANATGYSHRVILEILEAGMKVCKDEVAKARMYACVVLARLVTKYVSRKWLVLSRNNSQSLFRSTRFRPSALQKNFQKN